MFNTIDLSLTKRQANEDFVVNPNDRIAQAVIAPVIIAEWESVDELLDTERGIGGYGSTGK